MIEILTHQTSGKVTKLRFSLHNYIITISKQDTVWLPHWQGRRLFSGGKFPEVSGGKADGRGDLISSQTLSELKFLPVTNAVFWAEMWGRVGRTGSRTDAYPHTAAVFFLLIYVAKDSYSYYVTFVRSCSVALWDISLYLVEWRTCTVIRLSDRHSFSNCRATGFMAAQMAASDIWHSLFVVAECGSCLKTKTA